MTVSTDEKVIVRDGKEYKLVFDRPESLSEKRFTYCPGCNHGTVHRLIAEIIDELGIKHRCIGMASVGCSVFSYEFFDFDFISCAHGRALAVGTGVKRVLPDAVVISYQGDGDLAAIGTAETIHSANRGERLTVIFINNAIYGMTGGQMAPTTLLGQETTTTPEGRDPQRFGWPIRICEMIAPLQGVAFCARTSCHDTKGILKTKAAIRKAFRAQLEDKGFGLVEVLSNCNVGWKMTPLESVEWVANKMTEYFPLGTYKDVFESDKEALRGKAAGKSESPNEEGADQT